MSVSKQGLQASWTGTCFLIVGREQAVEGLAFVFQPVPQTDLLALVDSLLRGHDCDSGMAGDRLGGVQCAFQALFARAEHLRGHSPRFGFHAAESLAREDELHGSAFADDACEPLRATGAGNDPKLDFGLAKGR